MTMRALELLNLPEGDLPFLLDIGCGSGLSGEILDEYGYNWVGVDIAPSMLGEFVNSIHSRGAYILKISNRGCAGARSRGGPISTGHRARLRL
jgi:cyclopropane fatty-acyl-phospholipid synthase-like methyltransferase